MKRIIVFVICSVMIAMSIVPFASAESSDIPYEKLNDGAVIFDGSYNEEENSIEIHGNINYNVLISYSKYKIEVYKLYPYKNVSDIDFTNEYSLVASMAITIKFSMSFEVTSSTDRFCKYVVVLCSPDNVRIIAAEPKYLSIESSYSYEDNEKNYFKGIVDHNGENTSVYGDLSFGTAIVPVYLDRLLNAYSNGFLFPHEGDYCYFDRDYIHSLSSMIRSYSASGARVYLQLLMPVSSTSVEARDGVAEYCIPDVYSAETASMISTYVKYLTSKFDKYTEGIISGFIVGDNIDERRSSYSSETEIAEYTKKYAYYLTIVANTARSENSALDIVIPISNQNSFSKNAEIPEGNYSSSILIEQISKVLDKECSKPVKFSILMESEDHILDLEEDKNGKDVFIPVDDQNDIIGIENLTLVEDFIKKLNTKYRSSPDNIIFKWNVPSDVSSNILTSSYAYCYLSLFSDSMISAFVISFENSDAAAVDSVKRLISSIDTDKWAEESNKLLQFFGIKKWNEIIKGFSNKGLVIKKHYISDEPIGNSWMGSFSYFNFVLGDIEDFYGASFTGGLKSDYGKDGRRVLKHTVKRSSGAQHSDLFCLYEYSENFVYTPALKFELGIADSDENIGALYEVKVLIGNGKADIERSCIVKAGEVCDLWLDMTVFSSENLADYIKISTRSITGNSGEYSLLIYDVCGYSADQNSEELSTLISEERARIRNQYNTENTAMKDSTLYWIVFVILIVAILAIGVLFMVLRRDDQSKYKEND